MVKVVVTFAAIQHGVHTDLVLHPTCVSVDGTPVLHGWHGGPRAAWAYMRWR